MGQISALYRGMGATMVGEAPYSGLKFCFYEVGGSAHAREIDR